MQAAHPQNLHEVVTTCCVHAGSRGGDAAVGVAVLRIALDAGRRICVGLGLVASKWGALFLY